MGQPHVTLTPNATATAGDTPTKWPAGACGRPLLPVLSRVAGPTLAYTLLAVAVTWPLARHLGRGLVSDIDPLDSVWRLGWGQERLLHAPWALFDGNTFYPYARSYLFDELLVGPALLTLPLRLAGVNPLAIYNAAVLLSLVLSALAMRALAARLGCHPVAASAAGLIYAFAPLHLGHLGHLGLLSGQYLPLVVLLLDRLFAGPRWRDALALAAALALQSLSSQYYAFYLIFLAGGFVLLRSIQLGRRRFPGWAVWGRLFVAGGLAGLVVLPFALGYRTVQMDYAVERTIAQNAHYSANVLSFFTADGQNWLWGGLTAPLRAYGTYTFERNMFPGLLALLLALLGAVASWRRPLAQYLLLLGAASAVLALGPGLYLTADPKSLRFDHLPYRYLYYHLPGFDSMRVPARIGILYLLSIAGLAGLGLSWLLARVAPRRQREHAALPSRQRWQAGLVAGLLIGGIALESANRPYAIVPIPTGAAIPPAYHWLAAQPSAVILELPFVIPDHDRELRRNNRVQYYSLYHRHDLVNGSANVVPKGYKALFYEFRRGATPRALAVLQGLGVTHLVVHYRDLDREAAAQTRATLGVSPQLVREVATFGDTTVYAVQPTERFARLRAAIPRDATVFLSKEDPTGAYGGMLGRLLGDNPIYTRVRVHFGQDYAGLPDPRARYDYAILYRHEDPAAGFAGADPIWEDDVVRVYRRTGP